MDDTQEKPKPKRSPQVRLENLDAQAVRALSRKTGIQIPYLLREAIQLLEAKHGKPPAKILVDPATGKQTPFQSAQ